MEYLQRIDMISDYFLFVPLNVLGDICPQCVCESLNLNLVRKPRHIKI